MQAFSEIEFKYKIELGLKDFQRLMLTLKPVETLEVSSWDSYYTNSKGEFIRFRNGKDNCELTLKRKRSTLNNQKRTEVNLALDNPHQFVVDKFVELLNYKFNFKIFKNCWIYYFDKVNIVYYIVSNEDMKEVGRFIEIEYLEDKITIDSDPISELKYYETELQTLGISPQNRLKKSLFEMYRRN